MTPDELPPDFELKPRLTPLAFVIRFPFGFMFGLLVVTCGTKSIELGVLGAIACGLIAGLRGNRFWESAAERRWWW